MGVSKSNVFNSAIAKKVAVEEIKAQEPVAETKTNSEIEIVSKGVLSTKAKQSRAKYKLSDIPQEPKQRIGFNVSYVIKGALENRAERDGTTITRVVENLVCEYLAEDIEEYLLIQEYKKNHRAGKL